MTPKTQTHKNTPQFASTNLLLESDEGKRNIADGLALVPERLWPTDDDKDPFYTDALPMVFRRTLSSGDAHEIRLNVKPDNQAQTVMVNPVTYARFPKPAIKEDKQPEHGVEVRWLTGRERINRYVKADVGVAIIGVIVAVLAIVLLAVGPSADKKEGRQDLVVQLQPGETRVASAIDVHDYAAARRAQDQVQTILDAKDDVAQWKHYVTLIAKWAAVVLGVVSAFLAGKIALKRQREKP